MTFLGEMMKRIIFSSLALLIACGQNNDRFLASRDIDSQVVKGTPSVLGARPYQVGVLKVGGQGCGGTILSQEWILTAAHCIIGDGSDYSIRAGSLDRSSGGQVVDAKKVIINPDYRKGGSLHNRDAALIQLARPLEFNKNVSAAAIPTQEIEKRSAGPGTTQVISGWGWHTSMKKEASEKLLEAPLKVMNQSVCVEKMGRSVSDLMICGEANSVGQNGCHGDSGGPFASQVNNKYFVFGITSWGKGHMCNIATIFTRVTAVQEWITKETGIQPGGQDVIPSPNEKVFEGIVNANSSSFQPNGTKGFDWKGGRLNAKLSSNASGDFDFYLQKKAGVRWVDVGSSTNNGHSENISYNATEGLYRWEVYAYEGSGEYRIVQFE